MLVALLLKPFFILIGFIISLFPNLTNSIVSSSGFVGILKVGLFLLPPLWFPAFVSSVIFYLTIQMQWAIIEWTYKKMPFVD